MCFDSLMGRQLWRLCVLSRCCPHRWAAVAIIFLRLSQNSQNTAAIDVHLILTIELADTTRQKEEAGSRNERFELIPQAPGKGLIPDQDAGLQVAFVRPFRKVG